MKNKKTRKILLLLAITIIAISMIIGIFYIIKKENIELTPEFLRTQAYDDVKSGDEAVYDKNDEKITAIEFDAFFLKDTNGDGNAESVRGTCNEIGKEANFFMELKVIEEGQVKDAMITINSSNFYFNTAIVKDSIVSDNYISSNTRNIELNDLANGSQALLIGAVRSGDYSSSTRKMDAIGKDTNNYSKENTVTFSGTYVDTNGKQRPFSKTIPFMVDWYGEVNAEISPKSQIIETEDFTKLISDDGLTLNFNVKVEERKNQLIMAGSYLSGTIPELNGYHPQSVKISGSNVTYDYNQETREFTAQREAIVDTAGMITANGYSSTYLETRINTFNFTVIYPIEAYESLGDDMKSFELSIPVEAVNKGYNNPNTEDGFQNPFISNTAKGIVTITWRQPLGESYLFNIYVGKYMGEPYYSYLISKVKPLNLYNGISLEETDDTYIVEWNARTGRQIQTAGIIMKEQQGKPDNFKTTTSATISMEEVTTNKGIYFSGATNALGTDGWIKIYNNENNTLIETFTAENWSQYTSSNPYIYENPIKHIRVETSATNPSSNFSVYNVKELDDEVITDNFTRQEFDNLVNIESYLDGYMLDASGNGQYCYTEALKGIALYEAPTSIANISIKENTISTKSTAENQKITISTDTSGYNKQGWKNGTFFVKLPEDIIYAEINSVTTNNQNVKITAYEIYQQDGNYFIKVLTENENQEDYDIVIDCNLTPDPRIPKKSEAVELYAINEVSSDYYYSEQDKYDIDGDLNTTEQVNYRTTYLTMDPGTSLNTTQMGSNYGDNGNITIAPQVVKTDKSQRRATITVSAINNYNFDVQDVKIQGVIPFEGNDYILSERDLGSQYTTYMVEGGISAVTEGIGEHSTIYYSAVENPTNDVNDKSNSWTLAKNVKDWSTIKTYLIVINNTYKIQTGQSVEFSYDISIPEGIDYNEISYSEHAIYFNLVTNEGLYATSTGAEKLGFMIAKQYDLEIVKYQKDTQKTLQGVTFTLTEDGQENSSIKTTDANGIIKFIGLFAERYYTLQEIKTTEDYILNEEKIRFYAYTETNPDGTESLYLEYVSEDEPATRSNSGKIYDSVMEDAVLAPNQEAEEDYTIQMKIENEVKVRLAINKIDQATNMLLKNVRFTLAGGDKNGEIVSTDDNGNILVRGLYLEQEYTLTEVKATGYYVAQEPIKFKITRENGEFKFVSYTDNGTTISHNILVNDEIPTIDLKLQNEKIPTYGLQLTKYAKGEKEANGEDKTLPNAQYKILGEGLDEKGEIYTTDENGIITIDGLYEYVNGKYITGEYTLTEIYAPEGYSLNGTTLKFKAYRENGTLKIEIIEGEDVIRVIETTSTDGSSTETKTDLTIADASGTYPIIQIGVEDGPIFTLYKYTTNGTTEKIPIAGTKFVITDLEGNPVIGTDGKTIGEWDDNLQKNVVITNETGQISANLKEGLYKAIEVYTPEQYVLPEDEADRTYYFGIGASQQAMWGWINSNSIAGKGWDYINSLETTNDGGIIGVGEFSEYSASVITGAQDGIDLNKDGTIDKVSQGDSDGIIVCYDANGNYVWAKVLGGTNDDALNRVIQTSDGGYAVVGYVTSSMVTYDGKTITELSTPNSNLAGKDAVLIKIDKNGNYEWGIRFGGTADDEIKAVTETSQRQLVVVGNFYSDTMNFYENSAGTTSNIKESFSNLNTSNGDMYQSGMNGFVASYSETGKYEWSQRIGGNYDVEAVDVTATSTGIAVAVNHIDTVYFDTNQTVSQLGISSYATDGTVVGYTLNGNYSWRSRFYTTTSSSNTSPKNIEISSLATTEDDTILIGVSYSGLLHTNFNGGTATTLVTIPPTNSVYDSALIEISNAGTYIDNLYILSGNYDDYIADIKTTSEGGILLGGWYYSDSGIDVDGDGTTTGEKDFSELDGQYTSDGFYIKLDAEREVEASGRIYGDGYDSVTSVAETANGNIVTGGFFTSTILTATSTKVAEDQEEEENKTITISQTGNTDGFVFMEGIASAEVPTTQNLQIENKIKQFKITTQVIKHDEDGAQVAGGDITGEEGTFGGVEYSKDGIRYVETVNYGEDSLQEIIITPDTGYVVSYIKINDVEYTNFSTNADGTITIPIFENVTEDKHIIVEFSNTIASVEVNHYLWTKEEGLTNQKVAESTYETGDVGKTYETKPNTDIEYEIITNEDYYGDNIPEGLNPDDYYIPDNHAGTYVSGHKEVINYYYKEKTYTLTVHHYIAGTEEQVPLKGDTTGATVQDEITLGLKRGEEYTTVQATEDKIDYSIYELVEMPENATGNIEEDTEVTYYYQVKTAELRFTKVAEEDHTVTIAGTEFALYALNNEKATEKEELIDVTNVASCWTLVDTYTTPENGLIKLEDLPITTEYRLVETKAAEDRMIADGQWKIEFMYEDYNKEDTAIITQGGQDLKITAIGNPPAIAITEDGDLQLPNKAYFDFPSSGSIGSFTFYEIGGIVIVIGLILLIGRKYFLIKMKSQSKIQNVKKAKTSNKKDK